MGSFSSFCYKGSDGTALYANDQTSNTGALSSHRQWPDTESSMYFYAVHPYDAATAHFSAPANGDGLKYNFTLNPTVASQVGLMYASTGNFSRDAAAAKQAVPLGFKHALTAVHFVLGDKPNLGKTIKSISLKNVYTEGTLILPKNSTDETTDACASWDFTGKSKNGTITLDDINFEANDDNKANNVIKKSDNEEYFLMIPQDLAGVVIEVVFTDNTKLSVTLSSGQWKAGKTVDYTLSEGKDDWDYTFTLSSDNVFHYSTSARYSILSYRTLKNNSNTQVAVPWEIVSYQIDEGDGSGYGSETTTLPSWLTDLSLEHGDGGTMTQYGTATLRANLDKENSEEKIARDNILKAGVLPSDKLDANGYYDLSDTLKVGAPQNTANCYVISAPGKYKLPLVYGNAITNGAAITSCYTSVNQGADKVLSPFVNHKGEGISGAYLSSSGDTPATAKLVWSDISPCIITNPTVCGDYLFFEIKESEMESGNAVVAVKNSSDAVMWSWHLWFAPASVLSTTEVTNYTGKIYKFTAEPLGYKPWYQKVSTYENARKVKLNLLQKESGNTASIVITQKSSSTGIGRIEASSTLYQFGRKDAFPGVRADDSDENGNLIVVYPSGSITKTSGPVSYEMSILNPGRFYYRNSSPYDWCSTEYNNAWSANNKGTGANDNVVVKTVYDPCPAGYHMPASKAFTGFTTNGDNTTVPVLRNVEHFNKGWYFYTYGKENASTEKRTSSPTIYFPATGYRLHHNGKLFLVGTCGYYWSAIPYGSSDGWSLIFDAGSVYPRNNYYRTFGHTVRPVQD
jgi:hypothetical protein